MRYFALVADYDGTLARSGTVFGATVSALERFSASGRKLVLVTGRNLEDLLHVFPRANLFDAIVAENGGVLYNPRTKWQRTLCEAPPPAFLDELRARGVPAHHGRVIVATNVPHEQAVLETIRDLGLELHVIFNKGAVMVLPSSINKGTGLAAAMHELCMSPHNAIGVGDAENDHAFLRMCECAAAVANALPSVKQHCDVVLRGEDGMGVVELVERTLSRGLETMPIERHQILLGHREDGSEFCIEPHGTTVLVAGRSGSGKTRVAVAMVERLDEQGYQFCIVDPEGDHDHDVSGAVSLGDPSHAPSIEEVRGVLGAPARSAVVSLLAVPMEERPAFFGSFVSRVQDLRAHTGRPHWIVVDEAHHLLPATWDPATVALPKELGAMLLVTPHPSHVAPAILESVGLVVVVGEAPAEMLRELAIASGREEPTSPPPFSSADLLVWRPKLDREAFRVRLEPARAEHLRHRRKYAHGELGPDRSFYFHGPARKLNLRAQNLVLFMQIADGVDEDTWMFHLRAGDYSRWVREFIKDPQLAADVARVEADQAATAEDSRARVRQAIEERYTLPA